MPRKPTNNEILDDIRAVAKKLNHHPTSTEYRAHGKFGHSLLATRFGSWRAGIEAAGLKYTFRHPLTAEISDHDVRESLHDLARTLGHPPSADEYKRHGKYSVGAVYRRFGKKWVRVLINVFQLNEEDAKKIAARGMGFRTTEERLEELRQLAKKLGRTPPREEAERKHKIGAPELCARIGGSWEDVCRAAGLPKPVSVTRPGYNLSNDELLTDLRRVASQLGKIPTAKEYSLHGKANHKTVAARLGDGSWKQAIAVFTQRVLGVSPKPTSVDTDSVQAVLSFFRK